MDDFATGYALGSDSGNNGGGSFLNGDGIWTILLFAMIFGWNGRGFGGGGFGGGGDCGVPCATQADVRAAVDHQSLITKLDGQTYGLADSTYALTNALTNGFHGVDSALCSGFNGVQAGFNSLSHQLSDCCCTTQRAIDGVKFDLATQFCALGNTVQGTARDIIDNQNANYRGLMDFLVQEKLSSKDAQIAQLQNQLSQSQQNGVIRAAIDASTAEIIRRTGNECPIPAYVVPNPNCCYGNPLGVGYQGGTGCGCGC